MSNPNDSVKLNTIPVVELKRYCAGCHLMDPELCGSLLYTSRQMLNAKAIKCRHAAACESMRKRCAAGISRRAQ